MVNRTIRRLGRSAERVVGREAKALNRQIYRDMLQPTDVFTFQREMSTKIVESFLKVLVLGHAVARKEYGILTKRFTIEDEIVRMVTPEEYQVLNLYYEEAAEVMSQNLRRDLGDIMYRYNQAIINAGVERDKSAQILQEVMRASGYSPTTARNIRNTFATGYAMTYNGTKYKLTQADPDVWGYRYTTNPVKDSRPNHLAQHGVTLPKEDSYWSVWLAPNGYNCRCGFEVLRKETAIRRPRDDYLPDEGFGRNLFEAYGGMLG